MDNVNSQFHTLVTDGESEQILFLAETDNTTGAFNRNVYLSSDGDMTTDGATFVDDMSSTQGYAVGLIPSRTMNVSLMNLDGYLSGHDFGWVSAFIGVAYNKSTATLTSGEYFEINYQGVYVAERGLYKFYYDGFEHDGDWWLANPCLGALFPGDGYVYVAYIDEADNNACKIFKYDPETHTDLDYDYQGFSDFLKAKLCQKRCIFIDRDSTNGWKLYDVHGAEEVDYYLSSPGTFYASRPSRTNGKTIDITDAFDVIRMLDVDATQLLTTSTATTIAWLMDEISNYCGLFYDLSGSSIWTVLNTIPVDPITLAKNSYTCRKLLSYIFEAGGYNVRASTVMKNGGLPCYFEVYEPSGETAASAYPIPVGRIEANGIEIEEFKTTAYDCLSVKSLDGSTSLNPSTGGTHIYECDGNPFVNKATSVIRMRITGLIPRYYPMTVNVLEADPSFQIGDLIVIKPDVNDNTVSYTIPIMTQTITFKGKCFATYGAIGSDDGIGINTDNYTDYNSRVYKSALGTILESAPTANVSVPAGLSNGANVCYLSLPPGTWIVLGCVRWSAVASRKVISFTVDGGMFRSDLENSDAVASTMEAVAIKTLTTDTVFYLNAASTAAATIDKDYSKIIALRIL